MMVGGRERKRRREIREGKKILNCRYKFDDFFSNARISDNKKFVSGNLLYYIVSRQFHCVHLCSFNNR